MLFLSIIMLNVRYLCTTNVTVIILDEMPYHFEEAARFQSIYNGRAHFFCIFSLSLTRSLSSLFCCLLCCCLPLPSTLLFASTNDDSMRACVFMYLSMCVGQIQTTLLRVKKQLKAFWLKMVLRLPETLPIPIPLSLSIGRRDSSWWIDHFTNDIFTTATI